MTGSLTDNPPRPDAIDLLSESLSNLVAISFAKSTSRNYPLAVNIAEGASIYRTGLVGKTLTHYAVFAKTREQVARALGVLQYVSGWQSTQIFAGGKILQDQYKMTRVLDCYLEATACTDWKAHCHDVINDPYSDYPRAFGQMAVTIHVSLQPEPQPEPEYVDRYVFPCRLLKPYFHFRTDHSARAIDQIQAAGVERGCDVCPLFDPSAFAKTGGKATVQR